jgi:hypothetical protein
VAGSCEYGDEPSGSGATELNLQVTLCEVVKVHRCWYTFLPEECGMWQG